MYIYHLKMNEMSTPKLSTQLKRQKIVSILEVPCMFFPDPFIQEITTLLTLMVITPLFFFSVFTIYVCDPKQHTLFYILNKWNFSVCIHLFSIFCSILRFFFYVGMCSRSLFSLLCIFSCMIIAPIMWYMQTFETYLFFLL